MLQDALEVDSDILEPGFELDSDLVVVDHLGGSRKVDIYLCHSRRLSGPVACKVLRPEFRADFSALEAVMHEGHTLQRLRHPNVVEGHGFELEDHPRIVMAHLQGQTLSNTFFKGNYEAFRIADVADVAGQLADALAYLHRQGLLHLDVKPSNVMYYDGHITLFDLSVAVEFSPERTLRTDAGTAEYMAPEQADRGEVTYATDVFGLGVVFYQLLTGGRLPYPLADKSGRRRDYDAAPIGPSEINPAVPASVDAVALKAIEPDAHRRYHTPSAFKRALVDSLEALDLPTAEGLSTHDAVSDLDGTVA